MKTAAILKDEESTRRIDAMARVFTKASRVLTGLPITCNVVDDPNMPAPSWTDGRFITFNKSVIGNVTTLQDIIRLTGLKLHEDAHIMFTQRDGNLIYAIRREGMATTYNVLEDQRIETLFTALYPSAVPYFISTFMRFCLMHEESWEANFPLMYGRYYLPRDVRAEFTRRFKRQDLIPQFIDIIDRYRKLVLPTDEDVALELIRKYHALLQDMANAGLTPQDPNGHTCGRPDLATGKPVSPIEQQQAADRSDVFDEAFNGDDDADDDSDDEGTGGNDGTESDADDADAIGSGSGGDGDDDTDDDAEAGGSNGSSGVPTDNSSTVDDVQDSKPSDDSDGDTDTEGRGGSSAGGGKPDYDADPLSDDELRQMMDDYAKAYEELEEVVDDAISKQRAIVRGDGDITTHIDQSAFSHSQIMSEDIQGVRAFAKVLDQLRANSDPGWETHRGSGRINVKRAIRGASYNDMWDEWNPGHNEAADIECVIIIDQSGSMDYQMARASRAMWTIKRAMEKVDASVTVLSFNFDTSLVYSRNEKVDRNTYRSIRAGGGTHAREAVVEAVRILQTSDRSNKIFIAITDGMWDDATWTDHISPLTVDGLIAAMGDRGITTALAYVGSRVGNKHKCQVVASVDSASDLTGFAKQIVAQAMHKKGA